MRQQWLLGILGVIGAVVIVVLLLPALPLNRGTLALLHGQPAQAVPIMQQAFARQPQDPFVRWQLGQTHAHAGNLEAAIATLRPLADDPTASPYALRLLIILLTQQGAADDALVLWQTHQQRIPRMPATTAAHLLQAILKQADAPDPTLTYPLLIDLFDLDTNDPNERLLHETLQAPDFWDSSRGQQLQAALLWLTHPAPPLAAVTAPAPDPAALADLLELSPDAFSWGDELVRNGSFEQHDALTDFATHWQRWSLRWVAQYVGERTNTAMISGRTGEAWHGNAAMRIETVWHSPADGREVVRAGIISPRIALQPDTSYVLSFVYRTQNNGVSYFYFNQSGRDGFKLAPNATWQRVSVVFSTGTAATSVQPMILLWNDGTIWVDAISLRPLTLPAGTAQIDSYRVEQRAAE